MVEIIALNFVSKFDDVLLEGSQKRSLKPLSNNEFSTQNTAKVSKRDFKMLNYIKFFVYTSTLFFCSFGFGQSIWENPITGTNPNTDNPYTTGDVVDANISVSGIGRGPGINGTNANNRYNASSWSLDGDIDLTAYFEWTLTPDSGCEINFTSFEYTGQVSEEGPEGFAFRSSVDGYVVDIPGDMPEQDATVTATIDLSDPDYQNISGPITFRFYGWEAGGSGGTFSINDFTFNGTTSCGGPPSTPSSCPSGSIGVTGAGCGCLSSCDLTSFGGPDCTADVVGGNCDDGYVPMSLEIDVPAGCTYTVEVQMEPRPSCSASGADGNCATCDALKVDVLGGSKGMQFGGSNSSLEDEYTLVGPGTIEISGSANRADEIITYQVSSSDCPDCTSSLPIELLEFNAKRNDRYVDLTWQTATETNNNYFTVEKSTDGFNFTSIGNLPGAGNSTNILMYKLIDSSPTQDRISYYRLKQTDFDGTFKYSDIVSVKPNAKKEIIGYYNLFGQKVSSNAKGIIIIRYSDGATQKVYQ